MATMANGRVSPAKICIFQGIKGKHFQMSQYQVLMHVICEEAVLSSDSCDVSASHRLR